LKQVLLYLPVIHAGYEAFLERHCDADEVLLLSTGFRACFPSLAKDIRALAPGHAADYLRTAGYLRTSARTPRIEVVEPDGLPAAVTGDVLVMPDEQVMRDLTARYRLEAGRTVIFDRTFLRWDRNWSTAEQPITADGEITVDELSRTLLGLADEAAGRSSDWWRQVGAVAAEQRAGKLSCATRGTGITRPSTPPISTGTRGTRSSAACGPTCPPRSMPRPRSSRWRRGTASAWLAPTCT